MQVMTLGAVAREPFDEKGMEISSDAAAALSADADGIQTAPRASVVRTTLSLRFKRPPWIAELFR